MMCRCSVLVCCLCLLLGTRLLAEGPDLSQNGEYECGERASMLSANRIVPNLVQNGGFECGPKTGCDIRLDPGALDIEGWKVIRGSIDYCASGWACVEGTHCLDLEGEASFGGVTQTISTTPGQVYTVWFFLAGNPDGPPAVKKMRVTAAGQSTERWFDSTGHTRDNLGWQRHNWQFLATEEKTTLEFVSVEDGQGHCGALLDNVLVFPSDTPWCVRIHSERGMVSSPAKSSVSIDGVLCLDKPVPVTLAAAAGDEPNAVQVESITFSLDDCWLQAKIETHILSWPKGKWRLVLEVLDDGGKPVFRADTIFENSGIVLSRAMLEQRTLVLSDLGQWKDACKNARFRISIQSMTYQRSAGDSA